MSVCKQCGGEIEYAGNPDYCYKCIMSAEIVDPPRCQSIESNYADQIAQLTKERDQLAAKVKVLVEALERMAGYSETVRLDRLKVVEGEIMCLQMEDWCNGLLDRVEESKQALEECKI